MEKVKKQFQKVDKKQATVNCGGEWSTAEKTKQIVELVLNDSRFIKFLSDNSATAKTEYNNFGSFQIRIYF